MENLPDDMRIEILLRLSIKSLACLKCVSKSWLSLISNPIIPKLHFQQSSQHYTHRFPYLVHADQMRAIDLNASFRDKSAEAISFSFPSKYNVILASCRGFLLLQHKKIGKLLVWNPTTNEQKHILLPRTHLSFALHAFCYDESTDDYLIALAAHINRNNLVLVFRVFSIRTNSWNKEFTFNCGETIMPRFPGLLAGSEVNGVIYWLVCYFKEGNLPEETIIALDIKTNNVKRVVPKQDNNTTIDLTLCYLRMFGDSLALIDLKNHKEIKVWVMKEENGVKSSWIKIMTIPRCGLLRRLFVPLSLIKNGQLVTLHNPLTLSKWSREQGKREDGRKFHGYDMKHFRFAATPVYTETLLSLPSTQ